MFIDNPNWPLPPATDEDFNLFRNKHGVNLPKQAKSLLKKHNGGFIEKQ